MLPLIISKSTRSGTCLYLPVLQTSGINLFPLWNQKHTGIGAQDNIYLGEYQQIGCSCILRFISPCKVFFFFFFIWLHYTVNIYSYGSRARCLFYLFIFLLQIFLTALIFFQLFLFQNSARKWMDSFHFLVSSHWLLICLLSCCSG